MYVCVCETIQEQKLVSALKISVLELTQKEVIFFIKIKKCIDYLFYCIEWERTNFFINVCIDADLFSYSLPVSLPI